MPLVSIIIPVYNSEKYLGTTINSLFNQTYQDFEIILVDDGSTDTSGCLCDDLALRDKRISVIHKKNGGVSDARNVRIDRAKGELIWFVDHDDFVYPDYLDTMVTEIGEFDLLQSFPIGGERNDIPLCKRAPLDRNKTLLCIKEENGGIIFPKIDTNNMATVWNQLYKSSVIKKFQIRFRNIQSEDELFSYEYMLYANSIKKINFQGYYFIDNTNSLGSNHNYIAEYDYIGLMENIYKKILENWSIKDKNYIGKIKGRMANRVVHYLLKGYFADTRVSKEERLRRWRYAKNDTFIDFKAISYLKIREKIIFLIIQLGIFKILDSVLLNIINRINK